MSIQIDSAALARRIAVLDEIGVGPLWMRRSALPDDFSASAAASPALTSTPAIVPSTPAAVAVRAAPAMPASAPSPDAAAWDDGALHSGAAAAPVKTVLTLCRSADAADATRYLFVARASSVHGADELFENILLALGLHKEAGAQGELGGLREQVAAQRPSVLIAMGPAVSLEAGGWQADGEQGAQADAQATPDADARFESLRGRLHRAGDLPLLVTYDAMHLLRNPIDKRKAWDDLCLLNRLQAADVADPA